MDKYIGNFGWDELTHDEQELIGHTIHEVAKLRPDWLSQEELDSIARFVRSAKDRKVAKGDPAETKADCAWALEAGE